MHNYDEWHKIALSSYKELTCPYCYDKIYNNICNFCNQYFDNEDIENLKYLYNTYQNLDVDNLKYDKKDYVIYYMQGDTYKFISKYNSLTENIKEAQTYTYIKAKSISINYTNKNNRTWYFDNITKFKGRW